MSHRLLAPLMLVCAVALGAFFTGQAVGQDDDEPATAVLPAAPAAPLGTAFTYQGELRVGGQPADGVYDFRFRLFDAPIGGDPVGTTFPAEDVQVTGGRFTVVLDFGPLFDGEALWLRLFVRDGDSTGSFTGLDPRQRLTAPLYAQTALTLRPGSVIFQANGLPALNVFSQGKGIYIADAGGASTSFSSAGASGIEVAGAASSGLYIGRADQDGIHIRGAGFEGVDVENASRDGFEVDNAGADGLHVGSATGDGVDVESATSMGVRVRDAGVYGLYVQDAASAGLRVENTAGDGMYVRSAADDGVHVGHPNQDGLVVTEAGRHGLRVELAQSDGVQVLSALSDGLYVCATGDAPCNRSSSFDNAIEIGHAGDQGIYVIEADLWDAWFNGNVNISGGCQGCNFISFGRNQGGETLEPGDVVAILGNQASAFMGSDTLLDVARAKPGDPLVGVVTGWAEPVADDEGQQMLVPRDGVPSPPGSYVTITIFGLVQVEASALKGTIEAGDKVAMGDGDRVRALQHVEVDGVRLAEDAPTLGIALGRLEAGQTALLWVLVNPQ